MLDQNLLHYNQFINESTFNRWVQKKRTAVIDILFPSLMTIIFFIGIIQQLIKEVGNISSIIIFLIFLIFIGTIIFVTMYDSIKKERINIAREAAIFSIISTINDLNNGDRLKASLSLKTTLLAISDHLNKKTLKLGNRSYAPISFVGVNPTLLLKRNLSLYIQTNNEGTELVLKLYNIVYSLIVNYRYSYIFISDFYNWLGNETKDIGYTEQNFIDKHPLLMNFLPLIISILGVITIIIRALV